MGRDPWAPQPSRWPLAICALVAGAVAASVTVALTTEDEASPNASTATTNQSPTTESLRQPTTSEPVTPGPATTPTTGAQFPDAAQAAQVDAATREVRAAAEAAVTAWQIPEGVARSAALETTATLAFAEAAATIDPEALPTAQVASSTTVADADGLARVLVTLADSTPLNVDLELTDSGWRAADITPAG